MEQEKMIEQLSRNEEPPPAEDYTPTEEHAVEILMEMGATPHKERMNVLMPLVETVQRVRNAPTAVKKSLFVPKENEAIAEQNMRKRRCLTTEVSKTIGLTRNLLYKSKPKKMKRQDDSHGRRELVNNFLRRPENSVEMPSKCDSRKFGLTNTMQNLYKEFCLEYPNVRMGKSTFFKCRDKKIKLISYTERRMCVCIKHANMAMSINASKVLPRSILEVTEMPIELVELQLQKIKERQLKYQQWMKVDVPYKNQIIKKDKLTDISITKEEFIQFFLEDFPGFVEHSKRVQHQYAAVRELKVRMGAEEVLVQLDFAENWASKFQNEPTAAYYDKSQTTVHPMVCYHRATPTGDLEIKSYVAISDEMTHSAPTVFAFLAALIQELTVKIPNLKMMHMVSDSPSSQYRNKSITALLARFPAVFGGIQGSWTWLEAGHGKGPCDGVGGALKHQADNIIKSNSAIRNAEEFAIKLKAVAQKIEILYVGKKCIEERRKEMSRWEITSVPGIMKIHAAVPHNGFLWVREISCFASCCFSEGKFINLCPRWRSSSLEIFPPNTEFLEDSQSEYEEECITTVGLGMIYDPDESKSDSESESEDSCNEVEEEGVHKLPEDVCQDIQEDIQEIIEETPEELPQDIPPTVPDESQAEDQPPRKMVNMDDLHLQGFVAIVYSRHWYVGQIIKKKSSSISISFMKKFRGMFKWGPKEEAEIETAEVLTPIDNPTPVGKCYQISSADLLRIKEEFSKYKLKPSMHVK